MEFTSFGRFPKEGTPLRRHSAKTLKHRYLVNAFFNVRNLKTKYSGQKPTRPVMRGIKPTTPITMPHTPGTWYLEELRLQVKSYLGYLDEKRAWEEQSKTHELPGSAAFSGGPEEVEPPEALVLLRTCRAVGGMWEAGGVGDQPHLLMDEFLTVQRVEAEYQTELTRNREMLDALRSRA